MSHMVFSAHINRFMRIREFIPESWWKNLDPGFLGMMGYTEETIDPEEDTADLASSVATDIKVIRQAR